MVTTLNVFAGLYALLLAGFVLKRGTWHTLVHVLTCGGAVVALAWLATLALVPGVLQ